MDNLKINTTHEGKASGQVLTQIDNYEGLTGKLYDLVDSLTIKLNYVLGDDYNDKAECGLASPVESLVPLADLLRSKNNSFEFNLDRLKTIVSRINI